jgi:hypothetical protein
MMVWSSKLAVEFMGSINFFVVREDFIQASLSVLVAVVSVPTLKPLEFWLCKRSESIFRNLA